MSKILIIEGNEDICEVLSAFLGMLNFTVSTSNKIISVSEVKAINPDLIIIAHSTGGWLGGKLCHELKRNLATRVISIILLSTSINLPKIAADNGADCYLAKPFDLNELEAIIRKHLK